MKFITSAILILATVTTQAQTSKQDSIRRQQRINQVVAGTEEQRKGIRTSAIVNEKQVVGSALCYSLFMAPADERAYKAAYTYNISLNFPVLSNKAMAVLGYEIGLSRPASKEWFANARTVPVSYIDKIGSAFTTNLYGGFSGVVINQSQLALTAGPVIGYRYMSLGKMTIQGEKDSEKTSIYALYTGLRVNLFVGKALNIFTEYQACISSKAEEGPDFNTSALQIGVGIFGISEQRIHLYRQNTRK